MDALLQLLVSHWVIIAALIGAVALAYCFLEWGEMSRTRRIVGVFTVVLALHMVEEYSIPGGFHYAFNVVQGSADGNAYPLSALSAMVTNLAGMVCFAVLVFARVERPWTLLLIAIFGIGQAVVHTVFGMLALEMFRGAGMAFPYSPGMANSLVLMLPLSIACIVALKRDRSLDAKQVAIAVLATAFLIIGLIRIPIAFLGSDPQTAFRFADAGFYQQFLL